MFYRPKVLIIDPPPVHPFTALTVLPFEKNGHLLMADYSSTIVFTFIVVTFLSSLTSGQSYVNTIQYHVGHNCYSKPLSECESNDECKSNGDAHPRSIPMKSQAQLQAVD